MKSTEKFSGKAGDYAIARPSYSDDFIDYLYTDQGFTIESVIADIGSGTGKFSKLLLDRGSKVFGIEPNADMRGEAEKELCEYTSFISVNGTSSETPLSINSVDYITAAQAFHWFDVNKFKKECIRILKPEGKVVLIWNTREAEAEINTKLYDVNRKYCPDFIGFSGGMKKDDERIQRLFGEKFEYVEFDNPNYYDIDGFISRCRSSSYSLNEKDERYEEYLNELKEIFNSFSVNGTLKIPNKTVAYIGLVR